MHLHENMWDSFSTYLFIDKKLAHTRANAQGLHSRWTILVRYFSDKDFSRDTFTRFIQQLVLKGYKNSYINGFIKLSKHIDTFLKTNEIQDFTQFHEKLEQYDTLSAEEIKQLAEVEIPYTRDTAYQKIRNSALIYFVALTGCRIHEALSLRWSDVFTAPVPSVIFRDTKNGEDRIVPLRGILPVLIPTIPNRSELVFDLRDDSHCSSDLARRVRACGIKKRVWWHLFRHSYVTSALAAGMDTLIVAKIVGHKDISSTQRYNQINTVDLAMVMDIHPLYKEEQSLSTIAHHVRKFTERLLNKSTFTVTVQEAPKKFTIIIQ